ncbi:MAG TPA: hypothetical protein VK932_24025, partial [Kofleriaceae bacterium]|nr:hypothetical protein [Kofleriaceae bacterium]
MRTLVHSSRLQLTRDGRTLIAADPDAVTLVELRGDGRRRIPIPGVQAIAAFADQVWVATRRGALIRLAGDGRRLDEHPLPSDPEAVLIPATIGAPAALWSAREALMLADDLGSLASVPTHVDAAIPISGRRFAHFAGLRLTLPAGPPVTLEVGHRLAGGGLVFEGTSLALIAEHTGGRAAVVLALASGRVLRTIPLPPGEVRFAARRGLAVVQDAARRFAVIDLRFGRHIGAVVTDGDVTDFAVDPDGGLLALRLASGELELAPVGERMGAAGHLPAAPRAVGPRDEDAPPLEPAAATTSTPCPEAPPPGPPPVESRPSERRSPELPPPVPAVPPVIVDALEPRPRRARLPRAEALAELDREIRSVMLWSLCAISSAWDTRRLGYGDEGHHPYEHEVAALVGKNAGFAPDHLAGARAALAEHEAALAADPRHRGPPTPLAELADEFGLSPVAIDVLLVIAAPSLDGDVARMYGILGNDPGRALVDELLVQRVLGDRVNRHDVAAQLHLQAPLVRLGIVAVKRSRPRPFAALEVDPVVLSRLRGEP